MKSNSAQIISSQEKASFMELLNFRFDQITWITKHLEWFKIQAKLENYPEKLDALYQMEKSGGEPNLLEYDENLDRYIFVDFCAESPTGRRSFCYDQEALDKRKQNKPLNSAIHFAEKMKVDILTEDDYYLLQTLGDFDLKTSSWIFTPKEIRQKGGALFCDKRYGKTFTYHNGADSYYAARGFRAKLWV